MKAKIAFVFYHDGVTPTQYQPGDELPADVAVPAEWVEASAEIEAPAEAPADPTGDELPADVATGRGGKRK